MTPGWFWTTHDGYKLPTPSGQETALLAFLLCTISRKSIGCTLGPSEDGGSHRPWTCDPPYPADLYALDHESSALQAQHGHWSFLATRWGQTWVCCCISLVGQGWRGYTASPVLRSLLHALELEKVGHFSPRPHWLPGKSLGIHLREQQWEFVHFICIIATIIYNAACRRVAAFHSVARSYLIKDGTSA